MSRSHLDVHHNRRRTHRVASRDGGFGGGHQVDQLLLTPAALTAYVDRLRQEEAADVDGYRGMVS